MNIDHELQHYDTPTVERSVRSKPTRPSFVLLCLVSALGVSTGFLLSFVLL
jgi:hypothetical protein